MKGKPYVTMGTQALCDTCAAKGQARGQCGVCGKELTATETVTQSMGKSYHLACFCCVKCKTSLSATGTTFSVSSSGPICNACV